jgi:hypothetical protein
VGLNVKKKKKSKYDLVFFFTGKAFTQQKRILAPNEPPQAGAMQDTPLIKVRP